jgi:hypothetical protein
MQIVGLRHSSSISARTARNIPVSACYYQQAVQALPALYSLLCSGFKYAKSGGRGMKSVHINIMGQLSRVWSRPPHQVFRIIGLLSRKFIEYEEYCIGYCSVSNYYKIKRFMHFHD